MRSKLWSCDGGRAAWKKTWRIFHQEAIIPRGIQHVCEVNKLYEGADWLGWAVFFNGRDSIFGACDNFAKNYLKVEKVPVSFLEWKDSRDILSNTYDKIWKFSPVTYEKEH